MFKIITLLVTAVVADVTLNSFDRRVLRNGLHRDLETKIKFTVTLDDDLDRCAYVVRENITKDMYVYYEEVTRDLPGFQTWPHHKKMDIEAPAAASVDEEFIWLLPFTQDHTNSWMTHYSKNKD